MQQKLRLTEEHGVIRTRQIIFKCRHCRRALDGQGRRRRGETRGLGQRLDHSRDTAGGDGEENEKLWRSLRRFFMGAKERRLLKVFL
jgi:hypothetical protein